MTNGNTLLNVEDLNVYYGDFRALKGISMDIPRYKVTALIGPSGCGKSTLLRCFDRMNDLIPGARVEGHVLFGGQDLYGAGVDPTEVRLRVGMVFQKPNPFPKSIYENVAFGLRINGYRGDMREAVERSLRQAALWDEVKDRLDSSAFELSGGQQQRVMHRARAGRRARGRVDGRARLRPGPHRDARHREPDARTERAVHHHRRHSQYAAGRPCFRHHRLPP